jgi:protease-4
MRKVARFFIAAFAVIGGLVVAGIGASIAIALMGLPAQMPAKAILTVDLDRGIVESLPNDPFDRFKIGDSYVLRDVLDALARGADDTRLRGIIIKTGGASLGLAKVQELREALFAFRRSGKFALAFSESFGGMGAGGSEYYLATAADELWLQPSGEVGFAGILIESPFLRGTLDKLAIEPRLDQRREHKTVMNMFTNVAFSEAQKTALQAFVDSLYGRMMRDIARARGLDEKDLRTLIDSGPFLAAEALDADLIDRLGYRNELLKAAREKAGDGAEFIDIADYLEAADRPEQEGPKIALVYGTGAISSGMGALSPLSGTVAIGADIVSRGISEAIKDNEVRAIILRIDSPGGSYVASDAIWREVARAQAAGKPVIASFGDTAASGGYFIAMGADRIIASPGTVTGSIGVVAGKVLTKGFWTKLGVTWDSVQAGQNAAMWSMLSDFTPHQWTQFQTFLDRAYDDFVTKAAEGRGMTRKEMEKVAGGRVWTGEDALRLGLIDELGGLTRAISIAKEQIGLSPGKPAQVIDFPKPVPPLIVLFERLTGRQPGSALLQLFAAGEPASASLQSALAGFQQLYNPLSERSAPFEPGILRLPEMRIVH